MSEPRAIQRESVEAWLRDGCGRCDHYRTPACKVHRSAGALTRLIALVRETELVETLKWGQPCYVLGGKNVVMIAALRDHCALTFFHGAALPDPAGLLEAAGPNTRLGRLVRLRSVDDVVARADGIRALLRAAIALSRAGGPSIAPAASEPLPDVLAARLAADPALRAAFDALTPGRQRSHALHIGGAKQVATRERRLDACVPRILAGLGFHDR